MYSVWLWLGALCDVDIRRSAGRQFGAVIRPQTVSDACTVGQLAKLIPMLPTTFDY